MQAQTSETSLFVTEVSERISGRSTTSQYIYYSNIKVTVYLLYLQRTVNTHIYTFTCIFRIVTSIMRQILQVLQSKIQVIQAIERNVGSALGHLFAHISENSTSAAALGKNNYCVSYTTIIGNYTKTQ